MNVVSGGTDLMLPSPSVFFNDVRNVALFRMLVHKVWVYGCVWLQWARTFVLVVSPVQQIVTDQARLESMWGRREVIVSRWSRNKSISIRSCVFRLSWYSVKILWAIDVNNDAYCKWTSQVWILIHRIYVESVHSRWFILLHWEVLITWKKNLCSPQEGWVEKHLTKTVRDHGRIHQIGRQ